MYKTYLPANPGEWQAWQVGTANYSKNKTSEFINTYLLIPTPTKTYVNPYAALMCDGEDEEDDDATSRMSNCSDNLDRAQPKTATNTKRIGTLSPFCVPLTFDSFLLSLSCFYLIIKDSKSNSKKVNINFTDM